MVKHSMDLLGLLRKRGMDGDVDFLREALRVLVDGIMDAEVSAQIGAEQGPTQETLHHFVQLLADARHLAAAMASLSSDAQMANTTMTAPISSRLPALSQVIFLKCLIYTSVHRSLGFLGEFPPRFYKVQFVSPAAGVLDYHRSREAS